MNDDSHTPAFSAPQVILAAVSGICMIAGIVLTSLSASDAGALGILATGWCLIAVSVSCITGIVAVENHRKMVSIEKKFDLAYGDIQDAVTAVGGAYRAIDGVGDELGRRRTAD